MPEFIRRKVTVTVEFTISGAESIGEAADKAAKPIEAINGAKIKSVEVTRL